MEVYKVKKVFVLLVLVISFHFSSQFQNSLSLSKAKASRKIPLWNKTEHGISTNNILTALPVNGIYKGRRGKLEIKSNCEGDSYNIFVYPKVENCAPNDQSYDTLPTYFVCFDDTTKTTLYTTGDILGALAPLANSARPQWEEAKQLFNTGWDFLYNDANQKYKFALAKTPLLGPVSTARLFPEFQYWFTRGHLFRRSDANTVNGQAATAFYINAAPQWGILNAGNWKKLEEDVEQYAQREKTVLKVWTGTYGLLTLPNDQGVQTDMYLGKGKVPVPRFFWKAVYDMVSKYAVVFVQVNNPHAERDKLFENGIPCVDICHRVPWLTTLTQEQRDKIMFGYTYCCSVAEFRATVNYPSDLPMQAISW